MKSSFGELLIINDNPKDLLLKESIESWRENSSLPIKIVTHETNLGFVDAINSGFRAAHINHDLLIVNSDTVFYPRWLENLSLSVLRLQREGVRWGSLTPFTNNGTIATIPHIGKEYEHFINQNSAEKTALLCDYLFRDLEALPQIPVGVGFCMLLNRDALTEVGEFRELFSPGYGEETEWCLRANDLGYTHFLIPSIFIYHAGGKAFSERKQLLLQRAGRIVQKLYPHYEREITHFVADAKNHRFHQMVAPFLELLSMLKHKNVSVHLLHANIFHSIGGVEKYVEEVSGYNLSTLQLSSIYIFPSTRPYTLDCDVYVDGQFFLSLSFETLEWMFSVLTKLMLIEIDSITLQHALNWDLVKLKNLSQAFSHYSKKRNVLVHDYYLLCTQHNLLWNEEKFCNAPLEATSPLCSSCSHGNTVAEHRKKCAEVLSFFNRFVCPSEIAREIFTRIYPEHATQTIIEPHYQIDHPVDHPPAPRKQQKSEKLSIIFLGAMGFNKGIHRYETILQTFSEKFRWITIGIENRFKDNPLVTHIDYSYRDPHVDTLFSILENHRPAFLFLGSVVPETFSFTLHEALQSGTPILTTEESGNIAYVVNKLQCGKVFRTFDDLANYLRSPQEVLIKDIEILSPHLNVTINEKGIEQLYSA